jgi:hypothetical protein
VKRGTPGIIGGIGICPVFQEQFGHLMVASIEENSKVKRGSSLLIVCTSICAMPKQHWNEMCVAVKDRQEQWGCVSNTTSIDICSICKQKRNKGVVAVNGC